MDDNKNLPFSILPKEGIVKPFVARAEGLCPQCNSAPRMAHNRYCAACEERIATVHRCRPGTGG